MLHREVQGEALTGKTDGPAIEPRNQEFGMPMLLSEAEGFPKPTSHRLPSGFTMSQIPMIRQAVADDEVAVRACAEQAYAQYVSVIGRKPAPMLADFRAQIAAGYVHLSIGEQDELRGFIVFFPVDQHMFLENVAVSKAGRGKGIGKSLIQFCEAQATRLGLGSVCLYTNVKMTDNLSIYPRLGYVEVQRRSEDGFDRVYFEKMLGFETFSISKA